MLFGFLFSFGLKTHSWYICSCGTVNLALKISYGDKKFLLAGNFVYSNRNNEGATKYQCFPHDFHQVVFKVGSDE